MRRIGHVATYPARIATLPTMLESIVPQLDEIVVVLNEFTRAEARRLPEDARIRYVIPKRDLKDTGKFLEPRTASDYVFLLDDDIVFPPDYAPTLIEAYGRLPTRRAVVGLHGVVYSDLFDGMAQSRFVAKFDRALARPILVNQLGTGCAMTRGDLMPAMRLVSDAQRFVDVRFARYCHQQRIGMVCLARPAGWLTDLQPEESIFETYTRHRQSEQLDEVLTFAGFGKLDTKLALAVDAI